MNRGIMNVITNRDVVERQNRLIENHREKIEERDEIITVQAEAIIEFRDSVNQLTDEIKKLKKKSLYSHIGQTEEKKDE